jgi:hypothetical protein
MAGFADDYNDVAARIAEFRYKHPEGSLRCVDWRIEFVNGEAFVAYTAAAHRDRDDPAPGIGAAWEPVPGKTNFTRGSELQNAETSAWGRAIVAAGAADAKKVASANEVANRRNDEGATSEAVPACAVCSKSLAGGGRVKVENGEKIHWECA